MDDAVVERVLRCVEAIPPGQVASYGDVGTIVGLGPRQVGRILAGWGASVPWWRVTAHDGRLPPELLERARPRWADEGIPVGGQGCRLGECHTDLLRLRAAWSRAVTDVPDPTHIEQPDGK